MQLTVAIAQLQLNPTTYNDSVELSINIHSSLVAFMSSTLFSAYVSLRVRGLMPWARERECDNVYSLHNVAITYTGHSNFLRYSETLY